MESSLPTHCRTTRVIVGIHPNGTTPSAGSADNIIAISG
jgi:hypothetical protein